MGSLFQYSIILDDYLRGFLLNGIETNKFDNTMSETYAIQSNSFNCEQGDEITFKIYNGERFGGLGGKILFGKNEFSIYTPFGKVDQRYIDYELIVNYTNYTLHGIKDLNGNAVNDIEIYIVSQFLILLLLLLMRNLLTMGIKLI